MKRLSAICAVLSVLLSGLFGCSLGAPTPSDTPIAQVSSGSAPSSQAGGSGTPSTDASASVDPNDLGPVVGTRTGSIDGHPVRVEIHRIVRDESLARVTLVLTASDEVTISDALTDNDFSRGQNDPYTADGVTLIDAHQGKAYLVASTTDRKCLCSQLGSAQLAPGQRLLVYATFAAPPAGVSALDVQVPGFGVFAGVPVV